MKTSIGAIAAWIACVALLGQPLPIFAAIAALLVVQPSVNQSVAKGIERSIGVIAGVIVAYLAGLAFGPQSWLVLAVVVVSLLIAWALKLGPGSSNQIPISAMLVLAIGAMDAGYAIDRIIETIIGAAAGLLINVAIVPPVLLAPAQRAVATLLNDCANILDRLAESLRQPQTRVELDALLRDARTTLTARDDAILALERAEESLHFNPRRSAHKTGLDHDRELLRRLRVLVTRIVGMTRAIHDRYDPTLLDEPTVGAIATELSRAAHDLRLLGRDSDAIAATEVPTITAELPALTAPLMIARPHPQHWILIGSLLEDLRRIREEIIGEAVE